MPLRRANPRNVSRSNHCFERWLPKCEISKSISATMTFCFHHDAPQCPRPINGNPFLLDLLQCLTLLPCPDLQRIFRPKVLPGANLCSHDDVQEPVSLSDATIHIPHRRLIPRDETVIAQFAPDRFFIQSPTNILARIIHGGADFLEVSGN